MINALKECIGCQAAGLPEPGYDFYCCSACLDKLANKLESFCIGGPDADERIYDVD